MHKRAHTFITHTHTQHQSDKAYVITVWCTNFVGRNRLFNKVTIFTVSKYEIMMLRSNHIIEKNLRLKCNTEKMSDKMQYSFISSSRQRKHIIIEIGNNLLGYPAPNYNFDSNR